MSHLSLASLITAWSRIRSYHPNVSVRRISSSPFWGDDCGYGSDTTVRTLASELRLGDRPRCASFLMMRRRPISPRPQRRHDGKVAVARSNQRWCSDGFEFRCDNCDPRPSAGSLLPMRWHLTVFAGASGRIVTSGSYFLIL